jgi:two-component system nitrate/nitrite sensor histidine kinase NarX
VRLTDDGAVYLGVEDNGIGMRKAMHDSEPHHGLIIMQERAHGLGGTLKVEDREGGGTCLRVYRPRQRSVRSDAIAARDQR